MCKDTVNVRIRKRLTIGLVVSALVMALLMISASVADKYAQKNNITVWRGVSPRDPDPKYCEFMPVANVSNSTLINNTRTHFFLKEKINSISSLSFILPSLLPFFFFAFDAKNGCTKAIRKNKFKTTIMARYPAFSFLTSIISLLHVAGTFTNHACACKRGLILDNIFQWLMLGLPIIFTGFVYSNNYTKRRTPRFYVTWILIYALYSILVIVLAILNLKIIYQLIITVLLVVFIMVSNIIGISSNKTVAGNKPLFWLAFICAIIGLFFGGIDSQICDQTKSIGAPGTHFMWHIFGSLSLTVLYVHQWTIKENFGYIKTMLDQV